MWVKLRRAVSQQPPDARRPVVTRPDRWVEIRGFVGYPGEVDHGHEAAGWSFWENHDVDLSPIYEQDEVERVCVEPGHEHAERLRSDGRAPFEVVVAEGPPAGHAG
jgi:hypothetical protein